MQKVKKNDECPCVFCKKELSIELLEEVCSPYGCVEYQIWNNRR